MIFKTNAFDSGGDRESREMKKAKIQQRLQPLRSGLLLHPCDWHDTWMQESEQAALKVI
ncbi:hypothetical protein ACO0LL_14105 [Undibacterium sp. TC4M20W]|uniref:hypothetical protein n=1 Tax=Undibacterium sp. TC4M20W TaxID=3413052 RepID=UPI003BF1AACB